MAPLVAEILATLRKAAESGVLRDDTEEAITQAADLVAKAQCLHYQSGFPEIDATELTAAEGRDLERALLELLRQHSDSELACTLICALGKSDDPAYVEEFAGHLERGVRMLVEANGLVFNALCYLDKVEPGAVEQDARGGTTLGVTWVEKNLRQARAYRACNESCVRNAD